MGYLRNRLVNVTPPATLLVVEASSPLKFLQGQIMNTEARCADLPKSAQMDLGKARALLLAQADDHNTEPFRAVAKQRTETEASTYDFRSAAKRRIEGWVEASTYDAVFAYIDEVPFNEELRLAAKAVLWAEMVGVAEAKMAAYACESEKFSSRSLRKAKSATKFLDDLLNAYYGVWAEWSSVAETTNDKSVVMAWCQKLSALERAQQRLAKAAEPLITRGETLNDDERNELRCAVSAATAERDAAKRGRTAA